MKHTIYATFKDPKQAEKAAGALMDRGLRPEDLSIINSQQRSEPSLAGSAALKGSAWGVGIGTVAAAASLLVPGVGLVVGGGALATAIAGTAASAGAGAAGSVLTGYFKHQGADSQVAAEYERTIRLGGAVLGATLPSGGVDEGRAWEVLTKYAGQHVISHLDRPYLS